MDNKIAELEAQIAALQRTIRVMQEYMNVRFNQQQKAIDALIAAKPKTLQFLERLPEASRITAIRAERFHNSGKGRSEHQLKIHVSVDGDPDPRGSVKPYTFRMTSIEDCKAPEDTLLAKTAAHLAGYPVRIGCMSRKTNGEKKYYEYVAMWNDETDALVLNIGGVSFKFAPPIPLKAGRATNAPIRVWYWKPSA